MMKKSINGSEQALQWMDTKALQLVDLFFGTLLKAGMKTKNLEKKLYLK